MNERSILIAARALGVVFNPFYLPVVGMIVLFTLSYLSLLPWFYKLTVLAIVYIFTILIPTLLIRMYRKYEGWSLFELYSKERRMIPYVISIGCYLACYYVMRLLHIPHFMGCIVVAALMIQMVCAIANLWWKVSTHTAAIGGMAGALMGFGELFGFNPVWWLCAVVMLAGLVGTGRMIMRRHSLGEVSGGFVIGLITAFATIVIM